MGDSPVAPWRRRSSAMLWRLLLAGGLAQKQFGDERPGDELPDAEAGVAEAGVAWGKQIEVPGLNLRHTRHVWQDGQAAAGYPAQTVLHQRVGYLVQAVRSLALALETRLERPGIPSLAQSIPLKLSETACLDRRPRPGIFYLGQTIWSPVVQMPVD